MDTVYINFLEAQVTATIVDFLLAVTLFALTNRRLHGAEKDSARLMSIGFFVAAMHFALQRLFHFHNVDPVLGYSVNLVFIMMVVYFFFISLLWLLKKGRMELHEWLYPLLVWLCSLVLLVGIRYFFLLINPEIQRTEHTVLLAMVYIVSGLCVLETLYLFSLIHSSYKQLARSVLEFSDRSMGELFSWLTIGTRLLLVLILGLPLIMHFRSVGLVLYIYAITIVMGYLCAAFMFYCVSKDAIIASKVETINEELESNRNERKVAAEERAALQNLVSSRIDKWLGGEGYLQPSISIKDAANEMDLEVDQLRCWLAAGEKGFFSQWLSHLRIEYAMKMLREHPNWTIDSVADACGFSNRQGFIRAFKKENGQTPGDWLKMN